MKIVTRIIDGICFAAKVICAFLLALMLVISLIEIVRRYIFGYSFPWADELIRYCLVAVASLGGASVYREAGGLVAFDMLQTHLYNKIRFILEIIVNTIVLGFSVFMFKNALSTVMTPSIQNQISIGLHISMMWPYLPIVFGMAILVLLSLEKYYRIFEAFKDGSYDKPEGTCLSEGGSQQ